MQLRKKETIYDPNLTSEQKKDADKIITQKNILDHSQIEGEIEKTEEELKMIEKINNYLNQEFKELGIEEKIELLPGQFHLFSHTDYKKNFPEAESYAAAWGDFAVFDKELIQEDYSKFHAFLHEAIHIVSKNKELVYLNENKEVKIKSLKSGYRTSHRNEKEHTHFKGFNEVVVDVVVLELVTKHENELEQKFGIKPEEVRKSEHFYSRYMGILNTILTEITKEYEMDKRSAWKGIKRDIFTGNMFGLRKIEKIFGRGSLRVIGSLGCCVNEIPEEKAIEKIEKFLKTRDENKQKEMAKEILTDREYQEYLKRFNDYSDN